MRLAIRTVRELPDAPPWRPVHLPALGGGLGDRPYPSHDGTTIAWLTDEFEYRMGGYDYALRVGPAGRRVTALEPLISGVQRPDAYQPWTHDDRWLLVERRDAAPFLCDPETGSTTRLPSETSLPWPLRVAVCSPRLPVAFLAGWSDGEEAGIFLALGASARSRTRPALVRTSLPTDLLSAWWLPNGAQLLALRQDGPVPSLECYDWMEATPVASLNLAPSLLVPYDEERYRALPRDRDSLSADRHGWTVGAYLDRWRDATFDPESSSLQLTVARPTGETRRTPWGGTAHMVRWRRVEATLDID